MPVEGGRDRSGRRLGVGGRDGSDVVEDRQAPGTQDLGGGHGEHGEHAAGLVSVGHRGVGEGEEALLRAVAPLQHERQVLVPRGLAPLEHRPLHRTDRVPDLRELLGQRTAQRVGVLLPQHRHVGVVVEHDELLAPGERHRVLAAQHHAHGRAQDGRPLRRRPQDVAVPRVGSHPLGHLSGTREDRVTGPRCRVVVHTGPRVHDGHVGRRGGRLRGDVGFPWRSHGTTVTRATAPTRGASRVLHDTPTSTHRTPTGIRSGARHAPGSGSRSRSSACTGCSGCRPRRRSAPR